MPLGIRQRNAEGQAAVANAARPNTRQQNALRKHAAVTVKAPTQPGTSNAQKEMKKRNVWTN